MVQLFSTGTEFVLIEPPFSTLNIAGSSLNPIYPSGYIPEMIATPDLDGNTYDFTNDAVFAPASDLPNHPNHEAFCAHNRLTVEYMNSRQKPVTFTVFLEWFKNDVSLFKFGGSFTIPEGFLAAGDIAAFSFAGWVNEELDESATYKIIATATDTRGLDETETHTWTVINGNITDFEKGDGSEGYMWIEGNNLHYIDGEQFEHSVLPAFANITTSVPGHISWICYS